MRLLALGHLRRLSSFSVTNPSLRFSFKQRFPLNDLLRVQNTPETLSQTSENPLAWRLAFCPDHTGSLQHRCWPKPPCGPRLSTVWFSSVWTWPVRRCAIVKDAWDKHLKEGRVVYLGSWFQSMVCWLFNSVARRKHCRGEHGGKAARPESGATGRTRHEDTPPASHFLHLRTSTVPTPPN